MKTLLQVPDLLEAISPLIDVPVSTGDVFRLISSGQIRPLGFLRRMPVFDLGQIADIAGQVEKLKGGHKCSA
jgi:hypothetical protein